MTTEESNKAPNYTESACQGPCLADVSTHKGQDLLLMKEKYLSLHAAMTEC